LLQRAMRGADILFVACRAGRREAGEIIQFCKGDTRDGTPPASPFYQDWPAASA